MAALDQLDISGALPPSNVNDFGRNRVLHRDSWSEQMKMKMAAFPLRDIRGANRHRDAKDRGKSRVNRTCRPSSERVVIFMAVSPRRVTRGAKERNGVIDRGKTRALTPWNWWAPTAMIMAVLALRVIRCVRTHKNASDRGKRSAPR